MNKWIKKHIRELSKDGITFIPNAISKKKCECYINRFPDMLGDNFPRYLRDKVKNKTKENVLRLLHYYSTPPKNELERRYTLTKDPKVIDISKSL